MIAATRSAEWPITTRAAGRLALRVGVGYFAGQLALAAHDEHISFAMPGPYRYHG
jgi:hypothetical protein